MDTNQPSALIGTVPGPLYWGMRWRRWDNHTPTGAWAGKATAPFWNAWQNGQAILRRIGIKVRPTRNHGWWVTWEGPHGAGDNTPRRGDDGRQPLQSLVQSAIETVAQADEDRARERNGIGFSRNDTALGHELTNDDEWTTNDLMNAWHMLRKYHRQIPSTLYSQIYGQASDEAQGTERKDKREAGTQREAFREII